jgi:hypothetical protein
LFTCTGKNSNLKLISNINNSYFLPENRELMQKYRARAGPYERFHLRQPGFHLTNRHWSPSLFLPDFIAGCLDRVGD